MYSIYAETCKLPCSILLWLASSRRLAIASVYEHASQVSVGVTT